MCVTLCRPAGTSLGGEPLPSTRSAGLSCFRHPAWAEASATTPGLIHLAPRCWPGLFCAPRLAVESIECLLARAGTSKHQALGRSSGYGLTPGKSVTDVTTPAGLLTFLLGKFHSHARRCHYRGNCCPPFRPVGRLRNCRIAPAGATTVSHH